MEPVLRSLAIVLQVIVRRLNLPVEAHVQV
jgi:hypothetical protein